MDRPDPSASGPGSGHHIALGRGLVVIVVAVAVGALIVHSWGSGRPSVSVPSTSLPRPSTTTRPVAPASTSTTTPHAQVKVLVANDSTTNGVAAEYSTVLQRAGWNVLAPVTAKPPARATSEVFYAANKQQDADAVALAFGLPLSAVFPLSPATPVDNTAGADVILIVGADLAAKTPPSTVPPTSTSTTVHGVTTTTR